MDSSYLNIFTFLLTTLFYYMLLKPSLDYTIISNNDLYKGYITKNYLYLAVYLLLVMVVQFIVNASILSKKCGGNIGENMGAAGLFTFIPWTLIFGVMIVILILYPGFKSAFSDVIGYYWVANRANEILVQLLINEDVEAALPNAPAAVSQPPRGGDNILVGGQKGGNPTKEQIQKAADLILKICGNTSILINQITPRNFTQYWSLLDPLKKPAYAGAGGDAIKIELFDLVVKKDNIGEMLWYIYTGLLLTSIVQLKITTRGCAMNTKTMEENYAKFKKQEDAVNKQNAATKNTVYTL
jgi:hypothetical protein